MKVLSNLFGNNTKINADNIGLKDKNNKGYTLDTSKVVLYENVTGGFNNITLSDTVDNYRMIEITYSREGLYGFKTSIISTDYLTDVSLITSVFLNNILRFYIAHITVSGTTLTRNYDNYINFTGENRLNFSSAPSIFIHKVVGYK